jgi:hypothetical protein
LIEHLEKSAKADGVDLDQAIKTLIETVDVVKKETEHQHVWSGREPDLAEQREDRDRLGRPARAWLPRWWRRTGCRSRGHVTPSLVIPMVAAAISAAVGGEPGPAQQVAGSLRGIRDLALALLLPQPVARTHCTA